MRYPSIKTIQDKLSLDKISAKCIRGLMDGSISPESFDSVRKWIRQCYYRPSKTSLIMCAIDEVLETFGVEAIESDWINNYIQTVYNKDYVVMETENYIQAVYCNMGEMYTMTVLFCYKRNRFMIMSYNDYIEIEEKNFWRRISRRKNGSKQNARYDKKLL